MNIYTTVDTNVMSFSLFASYKCNDDHATMYVIKLCVIVLDCYVFQK